MTDEKTWQEIWHDHSPEPGVLCSKANALAKTQAIMLTKKEVEQILTSMKCPDKEILRQK